MNPETFFDNFGMLADTPNGVQKLRVLILQLAFKGKLINNELELAYQCKMNDNFWLNPSNWEID